jgi:acyl carrier protein
LTGCIGFEIGIFDLDSGDRRKVGCFPPLASRQVVNGPSRPGGRESGRDDDGGANASLLLELVRSLIVEVHPHARRVPVTLDSRFDRDLDLASLELVELLLRVEDSFGVTLPSRVVAAAETPRNLLRLVANADHRSAQYPAAIPTAGSLSGTSSPVAASTLVEALAWHVDATPDRVHIRILNESGVEDELSYQGLYAEGASVAGGLLAGGLTRGDTVAIMLPTSREYFPIFTGVLMAGGIPVPIYPPVRPSQLADHLRRQVHILTNAKATLLVAGPEAVPLGRLLRSHVESMRHVVIPESLATETGGALPSPGPDDVALLQYTSGSTGHPKGVVLTHANLLANIRAMVDTADVSGADTFVSWLPLYHDMGLIGAWLGSLYSGMPLVIMPPEVFLTRPARWLWAISTQRGTISAAPNFAYELCLRKVDDAELEGLDLSSWRLAFNGAEPVSPDTVERFAIRFGPYGLRRTAITPVYGLAESSVGLAFPPLGRGPLVDRVEREAFLRSGRAIPADEADADTVRFVACGQPLPGHDLRIVDTAGNEMPDRQEGRIEFRGPSATSGYYRNPAATRSLFRGAWLDTGDLGYIADGDLYVTGRVKDLIIRAGRNLHPEELEDAIGNLTGVRKGCVAVFASPDPELGTERLVVLAETRETDDQTWADLRSRIVGVTIDLLGTPPDEVVLAPPRTVPKTSSGKIRRAASREIYERGTMGTPPAPVWRQLVGFMWSGWRGRLRRVLSAAGAFAFALFTSMLLMVVTLPLIVLLALVPRQQWRMWWVRTSVRFLVRLTGTSITVHGLDRLPSGTSLVVANHPSWLDGLVLAAILPTPSRFVAGEILSRRALAGFLLRRVGAVFVERTERQRGASDTDRLVEMAGQGQRLVMFPEGHLEPTVGLRRFRMGAFVVAARAGVPIVPIAIQGTRSMLPPGHHFLRRGSIQIFVEEAIHPSGNDWAAAVKLQRATRTAILRQCGEPDLG